MDFTSGVTKVHTVDFAAIERRIVMNMCADRIYTITGTRNPDAALINLLVEFINQLPRNSMIITGAAVGIDSIAARYAFNLPPGPDGYPAIWVYTIVPADRRQTDPEWVNFCHMFEEMDPGTSFRQRDQRMVDLGHCTEVFPRYPEADKRSMRSGTWLTKRLTAKADKPFNIHAAY